jgi:translocator assembly and maintenance protein 41
MALLPAAQLRDLIRILPRYRCAFAYGSGVYQQKFPANGSSFRVPATETPMIDFIVVTDNSEHWHQQNLQRNYSHYSGLKWGGPQLISRVQENFGAHCYFNTLIPIDSNCVLKYGVISTEHLVNDLLDWNNLYVAGRLHKPVTMITDSASNDNGTDDLIEHSMRLNRRSALHASLLLLNDTFTLEQLLLVLVGLSYEGDPRMVVGEDRNKQAKIVQGQLTLLEQLYRPHLDELCASGIVCCPTSDQRSFVQEHSPSCVLHHLNLLPKHVQTCLYIQFNRSGKLFDIDDVLLSLAHSHQCDEQVRAALRSIVLRSSFTQSIKGLFTAGLTRSTRYAFQKLVKMRRSLKQPPSSGE